MAKPRMDVTAFIGKLLDEQLRDFTAIGIVGVKATQAAHPSA
jgi:hypothetical protein